MKVASHLAVNCVSFWLCFTAPAAGQNAALGDSLAWGYGHASRVPTFAEVGASSCRIVRMVPAQHFDTLLISAGTNDVPGRCIEQIRAKVNANHVLWVVPVNGAWSHVLQVAARHGDGLVFYVASRKNWPHPDFYRKVL